MDIDRCRGSDVLKKKKKIIKERKNEKCDYVPIQYTHTSFFVE